MHKPSSKKSILSWFALVFLTFAALMPMTLAAEESDDVVFNNLLEDESPSEDVPTIDIGDYEPGLAEASNLLEQNFSHFLDRQELGFNQGLIDLVIDDILWLYETTEELLLDPSLLEPSQLLDLTIILIVIALFMVLAMLIDRQATIAAHRLQARIHFDVSTGLTTLARKAIMVIGRSVAIVALIILSFFPIRATFGAVGWTVLLTHVLVIFLIYRMVKTTLLSALRLHPRNRDVQQHARKIETFAMAALRLTFGFWVTIAVIQRFEYHDQMADFVFFSFRLTIALLPIYLVLSRDALLSLLPPKASSQLYRKLYNGLYQHYYTVLSVTVILLLFSAVGYISAAAFLLTRGYALLFIGIFWFVLLERIHDTVVSRAKDVSDSQDSPSPLLHDLQRWLVTVGSLIIVIIALKILALYEPLLVVLSIALVTIGHLNISPINLINVFLIIAVSTVSIRLFKSFLNAKVYPSFRIDIGAAYATNTLINYFLVVVAFIMCLVALGVHLSAVMVVMASLGVGIGFGLQNIAENLISGFILLFGRAVKKGDFVTVNDLYGRVEAVGARSVVVRTPDNYSMLIPSKEIVSGRIINWTFQDSIVRIHIPIGVSYDSEPDEVRDVLLTSAKRHPDILEDPAPDVWIVDFGDSSIQFELLVYFDCRTTNEKTLKGKFNFILWQALQDSEIEIPFPQRDLHLRTIGDVPEGLRPPADDSSPSKD